jgi:hypothetical protein
MEAILMAKNKQYGVDKDGLPPRGRTMEQQQRIDNAREHYRTRAERRRKGESRSDSTVYYPVKDFPPHLAGKRRPHYDIQLFRAMDREAASITE